jgi:hypothetical protein
MKKYCNYLLLMVLIVGIFFYYNSVTEEGFTLPGVSLPGVSLPGVILPGVRLPSIHPYMRQARLFGEKSVQKLEKMTTNANARAMMAGN